MRKEGKDFTNLFVFEHYGDDCDDYLYTKLSFFSIEYFTASSFVLKLVSVL